MRISDWSSDVCSSDLYASAYMSGVHHPFYYFFYGEQTGVFQRNGVIAQAVHGESKQPVHACGVAFAIEYDKMHCALWHAVLAGTECAKNVPGFQYQLAGVGFDFLERIAEDKIDAGLRHEKK